MDSSTPTAITESPNPRRKAATRKHLVAERQRCRRKRLEQRHQGPLSITSGPSSHYEIDRGELMKSLRTRMVYWPHKIRSTSTPCSYVISKPKPSVKKDIDILRRSLIIPNEVRLATDVRWQRTRYFLEQEQERHRGYSASVVSLPFTPPYSNKTRHHTSYPSTPLSLLAVSHTNDQRTQAHDNWAAGERLVPRYGSREDNTSTSPASNRLCDCQPNQQQSLGHPSQYSSAAQDDDVFENVEYVLPGPFSSTRLPPQYASQHYASNHQENTFPRRVDSQYLSDRDCESSRGSMSMGYHYFQNDQQQHIGPLIPHEYNENLMKGDAHMYNYMQDRAATRHVHFISPVLSHRSKQGQPQLHPDIEPLSHTALLKEAAQNEVVRPESFYYPHVGLRTSDAHSYETPFHSRLFGDNHFTSLPISALVNQNTQIPAGHHVGDPIRPPSLRPISKRHHLPELYLPNRAQDSFLDGDVSRGYNNNSKYHPWLVGNPNLGILRDDRYVKNRIGILQKTNW